MDIKLEVFYAHFGGRVQVPWNLVGITSLEGILNLASDISSVNGHK